MPDRVRSVHFPKFCLATHLTLTGIFVMLVTLSNAMGIAWSSPTPADLALSVSYPDRDAYTAAFLNVTTFGENGWESSKEDVGRYGEGFVGPSTGVLVHITSRDNPKDHTACRLPLYSTRSDRKLPPPGEPWIALIRRGGCNFEVKVENAYRSNAVGVLVYNDRDSKILDKMKLSTDPARNVSAVFIYKWKGEDLARKLENDSKVYVQITISSHTARTPGINRTSVLFVSITFILLMIISLAWLVFYYVQRFRYIHAKDRLSRRLGNAAKKAISKIPTKTVKSEDKEVQGEVECCAVCIEPYKVYEVLRNLPCGHEFHKGCIDPWLLEHRTCPMCKMDILKYYGFVFSGSQESILQMDMEDGEGQRSNQPRQSSGISPLPEIRAVVITDCEQRLFESSADEDSSRASTPDNMSPRLSSAARQTPVRQDLCVSCIAAKANQSGASNEDMLESEPLEKESFQH